MIKTRNDTWKYDKNGIQSTKKEKYYYWKQMTLEAVGLVEKNTVLGYFTIHISDTWLPILLLLLIISTILYTELRINAHFP